MKKVIERAATDCGIDAAAAEEAFGVVFHWMAGEVGPESWRKLVAEVPEAGKLGGPHRGKGFFGGLLGGTAGFVPLLAKLSRLGVSQDKLRPLLTPLVTHLKAQLDPPLLDELKSQLPAFLFKK